MSYVQDTSTKTNLTVDKITDLIGVDRAKYYSWSKRYGQENMHNGKIPKKHWLTDEERRAIIDYARSHIGQSDYYLQDGYRRIAYMGIDDDKFACSPASVYRVLKKEGLLNKWNGTKTTSKGSGFNQPEEPHKQWHTDIKYINFKGTFLFFISVLDGYSRYIVHHELRASMTEFDVEIVLQRAFEKYPDKKPKLITDNGSQYISKDFKAYLKEIGLRHIKTSPAYPQSNGKIERFHRSLEEECVRTKSLVNLDDARKQIKAYVDHYNNVRLHSSLSFLRPVDFLNGNVDELIKERQKKLDIAAESRAKYWEEKQIQPC